MSRKENIIGRWILLSCLAMLLGMMGCSGVPYSKAHSRRAIVALMDSAEAVMNDDPGYALQLMDSINPASIPSRALNARYALIYSEVQYKNYIPAQNDSLIMIAVRYYSVGNHVEQLFRSFYSLGCFYAESGQYNNAAVVLGQAEQLADKIYDNYSLGLLYTQLGEVFFYTYDFSRANQYYHNAMINYEKAGKDKHRIYALYDIGGCLMQLEDYAGAHSIMKEVQDWAESNNDKRLISSCLLNRLSCSLHLKDTNNADFEMNQYIEMFGVPLNNARSISKIARYYIFQNDLTKARELIDTAWKESIPSDSVTLLYSESLFMEQVGEMDSAIYLYKKSIALQNENLRSLLDQPILGAQNDYFKTLAEKESLKARHNSTVTLFLIILILFGLTLFFIIIRAKKVKNEKEKQDYLLTIKELRRKEDTNNEIINQLNRKVNSLFSKQYVELDHIFDKMMDLEENEELASIIKKTGTKDKDRQKEKADLLYDHIKNKLRELGLKKNQKKIDTIIDTIFNNLMERIKDRRFKMTEEEIIILRFSLIGFSVRTINKITGLTPKYIYQKRDRAIERLARFSPEIKEELSNLLK